MKRNADIGLFTYPSTLNVEPGTFFLPFPLHRIIVDQIGDRTADAVHFIQVGLGQGDVGCFGVVGCLPGIPGTGNGTDAGFGDHPGQGQLGHGDAFLFGNGAKGAQGLLHMRVDIRLEQTVAAAVVPLLKLVIRTEFTGEQPLGYG